MRHLTSLLLLIAAVTAVPGGLYAQNDASAATATCNFNEDKQLVLQYERVAVNLKKSLVGQVPFGKVWAPGGKPMTLFTNTPVQIGPMQVPVGAYTVFVIPNAKQWTLVVSKSTDMTGAYDQDQDLVRLPMDSGELPSPESSLVVSFAHVAPQQCNIRFDLDKTGYFASIYQK